MSRCCRCASASSPGVLELSRLKLCHGTSRASCHLERCVGPLMLSKSPPDATVPCFRRQGQFARGACRMCGRWLYERSKNQDLLPGCSRLGFTPPRCLGAKRDWKTEDVGDSSTGLHVCRRQSYWSRQSNHKGRRR